MVYIAAILLSLFYVHVSCQDNVDVINAFRQACPYTNFCIHNASQAIQNGRQAPCCRDCSCADDCLKRDNCCPDKIVKEEAVTTEKETCKSHFVLKNDNSVFKNIDFGPDKHYFVIETCPETGNDGIVKEKCAGTMAETLTDLIWVSDTKTNKIYNNRFCAECNGVRKYRQWNLATDCFDIMIKENYSLNISSYSEECLSVKPPNRKANENTCLSPTVSSCNETGLWEVEDSVTETLCRSHPLLFVEEARGAIENIYHNIFCFKCNKPQVITVEDVCYSDEILGRWTVSSFTAILYIFGTKDNPEKKRRCAMDEVEDPLKGSCLKLICPAAKFPRNGSCQRRFSTIYGLVVRVTYRLHTNWNKTKYGAKDATDYNDVDLGVAIRKSIDQALEFKQCDRCSEMFYKSNTGMIIGNTRLSHYFDFKPMLYTKKTCHEGVIVDAMSRLDGEEVIVNLNDGEYVTFDIEEIEDVSEEEANTSYVHLPPSIHETLSCLQSYTMKYRELSQCPMVKLDDTLYSSLLSQAHSVGKTSLVKSLSGMNGGPERLSNQLDTMSVCWQEYRKTVSLVTNASMISTGDSIMSTGALVTLTIFIW